MKLGAQLYTLRDYLQTETDICRSLELVAEIGYTSVQVSGIGAIEPRRLREICDGFGLEIAITHSPFDRILNDTERLIEEHAQLGCSYIGLGAMPDKYRSAWWLPRFAEDCREAAQKIARAGQLFMYHNHAFEFERFGDKRMLELLAEAFPPEEMGFTLDTYWVQVGGGDVSAWLEKLRGRTPCVHLKDLCIVNNEVRMAPVGEGNLNFPAILETMRRLSGVPYLLVEQDTCYGNPFDCLETSYKNLQALGLR